ncbi:MAG TPA: urease accessory protein UreD [Alphaproteobacteria bacterium]|nr:urease accessory protein UreD [Alphaproteobacteria bacterium]
MPDSLVGHSTIDPAESGRERGRLELRFAVGVDGSTHIASQFASYPFHLCRPFRFDGDPPGMATLYLQSCSGGIYEGDRLSVQIEAPAHVHAHVTTQAASIARSMPQAGARCTAALRAAAGSLVEYLPDPVILLPGARLDTSLLIRVEGGARLIAAEAFLLHDPLGLGRPFSSLSSLLQVEESGCDRVWFRDCLRAEGEDWTRLNPGVAAGATGMATVVVLDSHAPALVIRLRSAIDAIAGIWGGASALPNAKGAICRFLASDGRALRAGVNAAWHATRLHWTGTSPRDRRK